VKKSALDFPVSARVVSSGENDVEEENKYKTPLIGAELAEWHKTVRR
jgi:hypothetical protein